MRRFRFHLGTLVILVVVLGVGFAAIKESNESGTALLSASRWVFY